MSRSAEERIWVGFVRQRRSLIAMSLLLLFYETSGIRIQELTVLGNTFPIDRPDLVSVSLWGSFAFDGFLDDRFS